MKNSMQHWNGSQLCVVDVETTGLDSHWHEMIQICILPLDSNILPRKDVMPFYIEIKPDFPERIDMEAMTINKIDACKIAVRGIDREKAKDLLVEWVDRLGLPYTKMGATRKTIIPLGQNYAFDLGFMQRWLGIEMYSSLFDSRYRDTMTTALYINDCSAMHAEKVPYSKVNLNWLANQHKVPVERAHDAMSDCLTTAGIYRAMLNRGLMA